MSYSERMWRAFSRFLPDEFRQRVFEPALTDFLFEIRQERDRGAHVRLAHMRFAFECLRHGSPQFFWNRGRPTRLAVACLLVIVIASVAVERANYRRPSPELPRVIR